MAKGKRKRKPVLRDWSFLIFILIFGCVYTVAYGLPAVDGGRRAQDAAGQEITADAGAEQTDAPEQGDNGSTDAPAQGETGFADAAQEQTDAGSDAPEAGAEESGSGEAAAEEPAEETDPGAEREIVYRTVEDDYFADAIFIGDSRTVGMYEYGGLEEISTFACSTGLTVNKMFDSKTVAVPGQKTKETLEDTLTHRQFSSIYLMIGINEMGVGTVETFIEAYKGCVEHLRELQPDAVIYLQGILRVTEKRSAQGDYIFNEGIDARNAEIEKLADSEKIFYLDVNPLICDETGGMIKDYTNDGVHLKAQYIPLWKDYLKSHVVDF